MSELTCTLTANAGLCLDFGGTRILVDALNANAERGFSSLTPQLFEGLMENEAFYEPAAVLFTHCHNDHFNKEYTRQYMDRWFTAQLLLPEEIFDDQVLVEGRSFGLVVRDVEIEFYRLTHESEEFADVPHYGILLTHNGKNILLMGDCAICNPELFRWIKDKEIDLAVMDFPWTTLPRGRDFIMEEIRPKKLLVNHFPFPEVDEFGYYKLAKKATEQMEIEDIKLLNEPFSKVSYPLE